MDNVSDLKEKILKRTATVGVIGVGYVGSAVGEGAAAKGFSVVGYDTSNEAIQRINNKHLKRFRGTHNPSIAFSRDVVLICVPTPVTEERTPDLGPLLKAIRMTGQYVRQGQLVIIESTVSPGTTRNIALPLLEEISELESEKDFFLAFSPERIDPGNKVHTFTNIPKVVGGVGDSSLELADVFYKQIITSVHPVSSAETAEMSKMLENTFRLVNISLINEVSEYTKSIGIDIVEVLDAASTKPYGFLPHYPSPGVGGHCIPVDPHYLLNDAKSRGIALSLVEDACLVNQKQPAKIVEIAKSLIQTSNGQMKKHKILLIGIAYKKDISDTRESPAFDIWEGLEKQGYEVAYHDPYVPQIKGKQSVSLSENLLSDVALGILITPHSNLSLEPLLKQQVPLLDTTSKLREREEEFIYHMFYSLRGDEIVVKQKDNKTPESVYIQI